jgi:hypothetical protein
MLKKPEHTIRPMHDRIQTHRIRIVFVVPHQKAKIKGHAHFLNVDDEMEVEALGSWR